MSFEKEMIGPSDTIYAIVTQYEGIREKLLELSPKFQKLNQPLLFNTVARTTTVEKAAKMGGIYLREMLYQLNEVIGLEKEYLEAEKKRVLAPSELKTTETRQITNADKPEWLSDPQAFPILDVRGMTDDPFETVFAASEKTAPGSGFCLVQKFEPFPLIGYLESRHFTHFTEKMSPVEYRIYFYKI